MKMEAQFALFALRKSRKSTFRPDFWELHRQLANCFLSAMVTMVEETAMGFLYQATLVDGAVEEHKCHIFLVFSSFIW